MKQIIYQALPRLWRNGKFSAWDQATFSYLKTLGVDILWLTGVPRHAVKGDWVKGDPGSPFAIEDWMDINPYLADNEEDRIGEFKQLIRRAHAAGIRIFTDFIPNHVARVYADDTLLALERCDYDWTDTRKLDYSNPATEGRMLEVLKFWAGLGVDGFRCDMVELVDPCILGRIISAAKAEYPSLQTIAEVYEKGNYQRYLTEAGFDILYDKSGSYDILRGICEGRRSARELIWHWQWLGPIQPSMLNFLENHDEQRIASAWWKCESYPWAAAAYSALFNTAGFMLYFGQEVGEDAHEGHEGRTSIHNWCEPAGLGAIDKLISSGKGMNRQQRAILAGYKRLMALATRPVFREGSNWDLAYCQDAGFDQERLSAFVRYNAKEAWLVVCNYSCADAALHIRFPEELEGVCKAKGRDVCVSSSNYVAIKL